HPAVGVFQVAKGEATPGAHVVHGTFLTSLGDYRFLAGECKGGYLRLSCFDGAHAFLFRAEPGRGATMNGEFWSSNTWHETWTARKDENARLPEAFQLSKWNQGTRLGDLAYPDLRGKRRSLADAAFVGPCRILQVFGTWCPNCTDASRYLAELDRRYRDRGLRVLGLAFEHAPEFENSAPLVRDYVKRQGIDYPILIAGISNKAQAQKAFPALDQVLAYPTTIFLDRRGKVRAVHTGFSGPATGAEHRRLRQRFQEIIEELLGDR
ncbi:MAG: TlpA disulfide reductase family protein, partial [Planctomycetota bacterium]